MNQEDRQRLTEEIQIRNSNGKQDKTEIIAFHFSKILEELGYDLGDENLIDTPKRVARYLQEFLVDYQPGNMETAFTSVELDQIVVVKDMGAWSLCSHHLLPMQLKVSVGYLANSKILGLSKIPRIVQKHCHKLQLQERLTRDIADEVEEVLKDTLGVAVFIKGEHLCMKLRGIKSEGIMITSIMRGVFRDDKSTKDEFLSLVK